jgi:hypothetical protein
MECGCKCRVGWYPAAHGSTKQWQRKRGFGGSPEFVADDVVGVIAFVVAVVGFESIYTGLHHSKIGHRTR